MLIPFETATKDLREDLSDKSYEVFFDTERQKYVVYYTYPHATKELTDFKNWSIHEYPLILDFLRKTKWESLNGFEGLDNKEFFAKMNRQRELIDAAYVRNEVEPWAKETAHDVWHSTGKRVW